MKTSKVTAVTANGTYDSKFGLLYKFEYKFEDGQVLNANHKTQDGNYAVGEEVEYEVKGSNDYGSWGKVSRPQTEGGSFGGFKKDPKTQDAILYQTVLKGVMEYYIQQDPSFNVGFKSADINGLALEIAKGAKENINKL